VTTETFDIAVIGAGMAGASLAAELAPYARVLVIEAEDAPGYHTTGRSAAFWEETYGGPGVVPLTMASGGYLREHGFLSPRGALSIATAEDRHKLEAYAESFGAMGIHIEWQSRAAMDARVPGLRPSGLSRPGSRIVRTSTWPGCTSTTWPPGAGPEPCCVSARGFRRWSARRRGGASSGAKGRVQQRARRSWSMPPARGRTRCSARRSRPGRILPLRRTIVQLRTDPEALADMPLTLGINGDFYFKPQAGRLWLSPHDEIPDVPSDAAPEELDVAVAIDRFEHVLDWRIAALERRWACAASPRSLARLWLRSGARRVLLVRRARRIWHPDRAGGGLAGGANPAGTPGRRDDGGDRPGVLCPVALRHGCLTVRRSQNHHSGGD
jgi:D-arginine dehydrogenase